jgi:hypothetical protein
MPLSDDRKITARHCREIAEKVRQLARQTGDTALDVLVERSRPCRILLWKARPMIASSYLWGNHMDDVEWRPLPALWPQPAVWTDVGELMLLVFTQDGVPTWEVSRRVKVGSSRDDLIANGTADTFEAAKAAALFEARARSAEWGVFCPETYDMEKSVARQFEL